MINIYIYCTSVKCVQQPLSNIEKFEFGFGSSRKFAGRVKMFGLFNFGPIISSVRIGLICVSFPGELNTRIREIFRKSFRYLN